MNIFKKIIKQAVALVLCAVLALGGLPISFTPSASAAWYDSYMTKMKKWGVMTDGRGNDRITRAEMAAVLKRAFGFTRTGSIPFKDVKQSDWFYYDIATVYHEGVFTGTSSKTASPHSPVTREQILTFIGRCLRYEENPGKISEFTDGNTISSWSGKYVRTALLKGIISGYGDGTFRPRNYATRGEVAKMISVAIGTLVNKKGETELGTVFGNVTLNTTGATLSNTTIVGDLYLTGGVGLGNVVLDNVNVLGKIIVAGGGNSESSNASIILKNVKAQQLVIDPPSKQFVSLRAIGNTDILETLVKSSAYIQDDVRNPELGLENVYFVKGNKFTIAGDMKNVFLETPNSTLIVGDTGTGSVASITVDEKGTGSRVNLNVNAVVDRINLDTAADVTGKGDIVELKISANGCTSEILPEQVSVRDDCVAQVGDYYPVDNAVAQTLSLDPNILAGYPKLKKITPTSATALVAGNKPGTIYWALTLGTRNPVTNPDDIIEPSYGSGFLASGSVEIGSAKTEFQIPLSGLSLGGFYYISAVLVDGHDKKSPVKSQLFTTPDNTTPAMAKNYPTVVDLTPTRTDSSVPFYELANLQATVMAKKNCDLYYVLLDAGSEVTAEDLLSGVYTNSYGCGKVPLLKNTLEVFNITDLMDLEGNYVGKGNVKENTSYTLHVLLNDGAKSSTIYKKTFTTRDITPPNFIRMNQTDAKTTSVTISGAVDEDSTVYWLTFPDGTYPDDREGGATPNQPEKWSAFLHGDWAKILVANGYGKSTSKSGKVNAKKDQQFTFNITGLKQNSAYDLYYVALDKAGNYSDPVGVLSIHTLDTIPPTATQEFLNVPDDMDPNNVTPYAYSTINVIFDEEILYRQPGSSTADPYPETNLLKLYQSYETANKNNPDSAETAQAREQYVGALRDMIVLYSDSTANPVTERKTGSAETGWTIDYRYTRVYKDDTNLVVSFLHNDANPNLSALNLESGARYHFQLKNITDTSKNAMKPMPQSLPTFRTASAEVYIAEYRGDLSLEAYELKYDENGEPYLDRESPIYAYNDYQHKTDSEGNPDQSQTTEIPIDIAFTAEPRSTSTAAENVAWDMIFWFDTTVSFELFTRVQGSGDPWTQVGDKPLDILVPPNITLSGVSVMQKLAGNNFRDINDPYKLGGLYCGLNDSDNQVYEYALHIVSLNNNPDRSTFNQEIKGQVTFVTGTPQSLRSITPSKGQTEYDSVTGNRNNVSDVTTPNKPEDLKVPPRLLTTQFEDGRAPQVLKGYPLFEPSPGGVTITYRSDRPGTAYYILSPMSSSGNYALEPAITSDNGINNPVGMDIINSKVAVNGSFPTMTTDLADMQKKFPNDAIDQSYFFSFPNSQAVVQPEGSSLGDSNLTQLITGQVTLVTQTEVRETLSLAPNTDYLFYTATKGVSDVLSPVTVYHFQTDPLARPVLWIEASGTDATVKSDMDTNTNYKLFQYDMNHLPPILRMPFKQALNQYNADTSVFDGYVKTKIRSSWKPDSNNGYVRLDSDEYLVLDAIIEMIEDNRRNKIGSLFDFCAEYDLKLTVRNAITAAGDNTSIGGSTTTQLVTTSRPLQVNCEQWKPLAPGVNYCLVAYGYAGTTTNQSDFAFTGAYPISKPKEQIKASVTGNLYYNEPDPNDPNGKGSFSGTITVRFTQNLCLYDDSTSTPTQIPLYAQRLTLGNRRAVGNYLTVPPTVTPRLDQTSTTKVMYITFDVANATSSFNISLEGPTFSGESGEPQTGPLQINVNLNRTTGVVNSISIPKDSTWLP